MRMHTDYNCASYRGCFCRMAQFNLMLLDNHVKIDNIWRKLPCITSIWHGLSGLSGIQ